jgi:hypothetical protein
MFNVYSNDTSDYLNAKKKEEKYEGEFQTACSNACSMEQ